MNMQLNSPDLSAPADSVLPCAGLIGQSAALHNVIRQLELVARTESTVLILGETGTGKELVARALHERSLRYDAPLVRVNCSAIPTTLLESELFGHEKGAFTGALARRTGRFEQAQGGSIFLDEIGELSLDVQPKLLRVLQEREFERLGGAQTVRADVRLIAATHRDLAGMCRERAFRGDLYYRLNVFPIEVPPLRDRREDIPLLAQHFVALFAARLHREVPEIDPLSLSGLRDYDWPGNVRELQNVLERAMILGTGPRLTVPFERVSPPLREVREVREVRAAADSLDEVNRAHIASVLRSTNGVVAGPNGAAARLGLKRSTLAFRMKKLGIPRGFAARRNDEPSNSQP
jgi:transcriptional regulator with GAF, ATPase, and Fis domain